MNIPQETKLAILRELLQKKGHTENKPFLIEPHKIFHFNFDTQHNIRVEVKYLYLKKDIPFVASRDYDEVSVACLNMVDINELTELLSAEAKSTRICK